MNGYLSFGKSRYVAIGLLALISCFTAAKGQSNKKGTESRIAVVAKEADRRVDIFIDGTPFTSYIWPADLKKPVLYPINSARGTVVTRGFPLEPRPGESVDHPHQVGL